MDRGMASARDAKLRWPVRLGFAAGDAGFNLYWNAVSFFLFAFYTDVMGLSPIWAGIAYAVASVWDGLFDPLMGSIVDRTKTRYGRFRPYIAIGAVPSALLFVLVFWAPPLHGGWLFAYAVLVHLGLRTAYTVANIPYASLSASITQDSAERTLLSGLRMMFACVGAIGAAAGMPLLVERLGLPPATAWALAAAVLAVLATALLALCVTTTREAEVVAGEPPLRAAALALRGFGGDARHFWSMLRTNAPLAMVFAATLATSVSLAMFSKSLVYWFKYGLDRPDLIKFAVSIPVFTTFASVPLWIILANRTSKRTTWLAGSALAACGYVAFLANNSHSPAVALWLIAIVGTGQAAIYALFWSMLPDTVEYQEWKTGIRDEGKVFGFALFAQKLALGINALLLGQGLAWAGYLPNQTQSAATLAVLKAIMTIVPLLGLGAAAVALWRYPIDASFHRRLRDETRDRALAKT